jgi:hypothetical protein
MSFRTAGRVFASHYQIRICDDPARPIPEEANWNEPSVSRGFAGDPRTRLIGTEADLNDHWVELDVAGSPPNGSDWQRVTVVHFRSETGNLHVMSVVDEQPILSTHVGSGDFSIYVAGRNLGVDVLSLGEPGRLTDEDLAKRKDLEWYRIFVVPGAPQAEGRIKDD